MKKFSYLFFTFFLATSCTKEPNSNVQLNDFADNISVQKLGQRLINLPFGLNKLEPESVEAEEIFIGVHGGRSEGYEWIYPLKVINTKKKEMYFYRWPDSSCFQDSAKQLMISIDSILKLRPALTKVTLIGHSYGGILVSHVLKNWSNKTPLEAHLVASPLLGTTMLNNLCNYSPITKVNVGSTLFEWRTQHQLDSAYKDSPVNPQNIEILGSSVTILPDTYKGNRLGHNWSISWVADEAF